MTRARALVRESTLVLADEPSGNRDRAFSDDVCPLMRQTHADWHTSLLTVIHYSRLAARFDGVIELVDGRIGSDRRGGVAAYEPRTRR